MTPAAPLARARVLATAIPFALAHLAALATPVVGVTPRAVALGVTLYLVRMWAVTAGYHRYFSHRTFKTGRAFQAALAFLAETSAQRGVLWWAAHHRDHHRHSDTARDVHSPVAHGFWRSHMGWIFLDDGASDLDRVRDLARFPELRWLDRHWFVPPVALAALCLAVAGWPGLFAGFFVSTVAVWHATFLVNSLSHVLGSRRYPTADQSRNNAVIALLTLGEGWHNNHHRYPSSARNGFRWWEVDVTYYVLRALAATGLVWGLRPVPERVLRGGASDDPAAAPELPAADSLAV